MVDKVKRKEPLYGVSRLDPHLQGVAARMSRYSQVMLHAFPMFNFVNHQQHGVDTLKYFLQAEKELEEEHQQKLENWRAMTKEERIDAHLAFLEQKREEEKADKKAGKMAA